MQWWDAVRLAPSSFVDQHGVLAGFVVILIEETGVPVPVPGDFLMLGVDVHAREGGVQLWQALAVMELATLIGASILYVVAARAGRDLVYRHGRYIWVARARRGLHLRGATEAGFAGRLHRWRDGAVAGGLATLISTLAMNVVIHMVGDLALVEPGTLVQRTQARLAVLALIRVIGPFLLLAAAPLFVLAGIWLGAFYAQWVEPRLHLPDWLSGLYFALLPLSVAVLVVLPVLDGAAPDLGPLGPLTAGSEAVRHAFYGAALGTIYPLRMARLPAAVRRNTQPTLVASASTSTPDVGWCQLIASIDRG